MTKVLALAIVIGFIGTAFLVFTNATSDVKSDNTAYYESQSTSNISLNGNVLNNFRGDQIGSNNISSPWGPNNIIKGLYLAYNTSDLFIGINENISENSLMVFLTNVSGAIYGTYNIAGLNTWNRDINFSQPMNYFAAVYFSGLNSGPSTPAAFSISSYITSTNSPVATQIQSSFVFNSANNTTEIAIPWSGMFPDGYSGVLNFGISAFVVGGSGSYVGSGIPHSQMGIYNDGGQSSFFINNTIPITISNLKVRATPSYRDYPSFLLLNNFVNNSIWVSTGIPDTFLGSPYGYENLSIQTIDQNNKTLPVQAYFASGQATTAANLTINNTIMVKTSRSTVYIVDPPYENQIGVVQISNESGRDMIDISGVYGYTNGINYTYINTSPGLYIHYQNATASVSKMSSSMSIFITTKPGTSYVALSESRSSVLNAHQTFLVNEQNVHSWLSKGIQPQLSGLLKKEYYMSVLLVKDDQNPMTGEIAASPSPVYLYTWVRDGSFSAISLQDAGHIKSALKYWKWMAQEQGKDTAKGTWQTRFSFWTGSVSTDWIAPEYDSVGLFQIGIFNLFEITHNVSMISGFINNINNSLAFEEKSITMFGLIPEDHSIWEQQLGYYFWTQAMDGIGMKDGIMLLSQIDHLGSASSIMSEIQLFEQQNLQKFKANYTTLMADIFKDFYSDGLFAQYITPIYSQYPGNGQPDTYYIVNNTPDSSQILPIAMGFMNPNSLLSRNVVSNVVGILYNHRVGGLPRYYNDLYHYTEYGGYLQSSGASSPWIITTLFLRYYDESIGNMSGALSILSWAANHTQSWLLPEAIDPNFGSVIASTSPLTWSSAMYVILSLGYSNLGIQQPYTPPQHLPSQVLL